MSVPLLVDGEKAGISGAGRLPPREFARLCAKNGLGFLADGFNCDNNPGVPYRFTDAVRDRFMELATEIFYLIEDSEIIELPHVLARNDPEFGTFMAATLKPPKKPRRKRPSSG